MAKKKKLQLGNSDFKSMIKSNAYYVDKSLFIEEVIEASDTVLLIPRPRRFGKTLNLSMLRYFFDIRQPENSELFTNLKIWQCDDEIKEEQGKYPVIYISFKDAKATTWEECYSLIISAIAEVYSENRFLLDANILHEEEIIKYKKILNETANKADYKFSLLRLSNFLSRYYEKDIVVLIDEYDTPIQAAYNKFYEDAVDFVRGIMGGALKDNKKLYKGVVTGILRVSKESIFTGVNNIGVFSLIKTKFSHSFGFNQYEVKKLLKYYDVEAPFEKIQLWYDGYNFGRTSGIYNPWSILNFASDWEEGFQAYWTNSSANELIKEEIKTKQSSFIRSEILKLINGEIIENYIEENFVFPDLKRRKSLIWTLLAHSGYLTIVNKISLFKYQMRIPNYELKIIFKRTILEWFESDIKVQQTLLEDTINALVNNDLQTFETGFKQIIGDTFSYYDTAINHEYVYQSYLLGLLAIIGDDYMIKSNRESGEGRYDIMIIPHDKSKNGVVIEIKRLSAGETDKINEEIQQALQQIEKNKYYKELIDNKIQKENIVKTAIVFVGKEPYVNIKNESSLKS